MRLYITLNRLTAVISKRSITEQRDFREVLGEFIKDIWNDYGKATDLFMITKGEQKRIKKDIYDEGYRLMKNHFEDLMTDVEKSEVNVHSIARIDMHK